MANGFIPIDRRALLPEIIPATRFNWDTDTTATDPGTGGIKVNNADLSFVTEIYVSDTTLSGFDFEEQFNQANRGDVFSIIKSTDRGDFLTTRVTAATIDNNGWHTIPVTTTSTNGSFTDGEGVDLIHLASSQRSGIYDLSDEDVMKVIGEQLVYAGATVSGSNVWTFDNPPIGTLNNIQMMFSKNANLANGIFLISGEVTTSVTHGPLAPVVMTLKTVAIARTDTDAADIEVLCAGVVVATVATSAIAVVDDTIDFTCSQGDVFSVRNKSGSSTMSNVIVTLLFEV